jgi:hypothetical protein
MGDISVEAIGGAQIGWSVFIDTNADCTRVAGEEIIQVVNITADKVTIVGEDEDGVAVTCVGFNERGETRGSKAIKLTVDSAIPSSNEAIVSITVNGFTTIK